MGLIQLPPMHSGLDGKHKIFGRLGYMIRDLIEIFYGYLYHNEKIPLDPNLVAILERQENNDV